MKNILYFVLLMSTISCSVRFPQGCQMKGKGRYCYQLIKNNEDSLVIRMIYQNTSNNFINYFQIGSCSPTLKIFDSKTGRLIGDTYYYDDCDSRLVGPSFSDTTILDLYKSPIRQLLSYGTEYTLGYDFNNKNNISFIYKRPKDYFVKRSPVLSRFLINEQYAIPINENYKESKIDTAFYYLSINDPRRGKKLKMKDISIFFNFFKEDTQTGEKIQKCDVTNIVKIQRVSPELILVVIPNNLVLEECSNLRITNKSIVNFEMKGYFKEEKCIIAMNFAEFVFPGLLNN